MGVFGGQPGGELVRLLPAEVGEAGAAPFAADDPGDVAGGFAVAGDDEFGRGGHLRAPFWAIGGERVGPGPDGGPGVSVAVAAEVSQRQQVVQFGVLLQVGQAADLGRDSDAVGAQAAGEGRSARRP